MVRAAVDAELAEFLRNNGVDPEAADETLELGLRDRLFEEDYPDVSGFEDALEGGETVVTSAQFLIDSEARLASAVSAMMRGEHGTPEEPAAHDHADHAAAP